MRSRSPAIKLAWLSFFAKMSPDNPWRYVPAIAAFGVEKPWATSYEMIPVNMSPEPAVAIPGFPVGLIVVKPFG